MGRAIDRGIRGMHSTEVITDVDHDEYDFVLMGSPPQPSESLYSPEPESVAAAAAAPSAPPIAIRDFASSDLVRIPNALNAVFAAVVVVCFPFWRVLQSKACLLYPPPSYLFVRVIGGFLRCRGLVKQGHLVWVDMVTVTHLVAL